MRSTNPNEEKIKLRKFNEPLIFKNMIDEYNLQIKIFNPGIPVYWNVL